MNHKIQKSDWQLETERRLAQLEWENAWLFNQLETITGLLHRLSKNDVSDGMRLAQLELAAHAQADLDITVKDVKNPNNFFMGGTA